MRGLLGVVIIPIGSLFLGMELDKYGVLQEKAAFYVFGCLCGYLSCHVITCRNGG